MFDVEVCKKQPSISCTRKFRHVLGAKSQWGLHLVVLLKTRLEQKVSLNSKLEVVDVRLDSVEVRLEVKAALAEILDDGGEEGTLEMPSSGGKILLQTDTDFEESCVYLRI